MSWTVRSARERQALIEGREPDWLKNHPRRSYVAQRILATPPWMKRADIIAVYRRRKPGEVVDHVVPLCHPYVCGLHVPWNMRIVPHAVNASRGNRFNPHQGELLEPVEQLRFLL